LEFRERFDGSAADPSNGSRHPGRRAGFGERHADLIALFVAARIIKASSTAQP
jgi:hypothetical protein